MTDIAFRLSLLAKAAAGIQPTEVSLVPQPGEPDGLADDLFCIARYVDAVILAYGEEAKRNGLITKDDVRECFTNVVSKALDDAAYLLREAELKLREQERSDYDEHNTRFYAASGAR